MQPGTQIEMSDVVGKPKVRMTLPVPLRIGDRIQLRFQLQRTNGGRTEVLDVQGDFRVLSVSFDATRAPPRQILQVESTTKAPSWRAVRRAPAPSPRLGPTHFPPTQVR